MRILVVDDEKEIADLVELVLIKEGYSVAKFYSSKDAAESLSDESYNLAIIDIMMPDINGFELCGMIRQRHNWPIIMLTARVEDSDKIAGLSIGADDYITKPFNPMELVARVKAQIRRYTRYNCAPDDGNDDVYDCNGLVINNQTHTCVLYDKPVTLTPTEFKILWTLCRNSGRVVSSEELFETVWGEKYLDSNNTVMVHIKRIREKLGEPSRSPRFIKTVWGVGYKIEKRDNQ